ncbi:hypothetical protein [Paenibacillus periandrae]|nr:hypothetical protein [Paenibacillus periandrae]
MQFAERLQVHTAEDIGKKAVQYAAIVERIHSQQKKLSDHLLRKLKSTD